MRRLSSERLPERLIRFGAVSDSAPPRGHRDVSRPLTVAMRQALATLRTVILSILDPQPSDGLKCAPPHQRQRTKFRRI